MSFNTFGQLFRFTSFGESHGSAIGCVVDGVPPRLSLSEADIQPYLDRRRPGRSRFVTQRQEADKVQILSGVFEGQTTGAPVALLIANEDQRSKDYSDIKDSFRPGHADFSWQAKYGIRDYRGGGRSSARETAVRVAAGAVARKVLGAHVIFRGALVEMGGHAVDPTRWDDAAIEENPFFCPDAVTAKDWERELDAARKAGDSLGGIVEVTIFGVPAGWGSPLYAKLDAELAHALMSINAVKGVEIGAGFAAARLRGSDNADEIRMNLDGKPHFLSNNAGGILGGVSTGQPLVVRCAIKPTSSILTPRRSINQTGEEIDIQTKGRHDPCVAIRAVPVAEAMVACVLADQFLRHRALVG
ncbi:MAG: chorismate synthase [Holosporales bacterium]|jgi:chorismate synthase